MEKTFALIKPEAACSPGLLVEIARRIYAGGLRIVDHREVTVTIELAEHYREHHGQPYYRTLLGQMINRSVVALVLEGDNAVRRW